MKINNVESYGIAMLDKNGIVEDSFILTNNLGSVIQLQVANDSNVYVSTGSSFFKLNKKGKIEQNFNFKQQTRLYEIWKFRVLENGNIIAADANAICRLLPDGEEDSSFNIGTGINVSSTGLDFDLQANKIIWGSLFDKYNGTNVHRLIRLN